MHVLCIVCALGNVALTTFIKQQDNNMLSLLAWNIFSTQLDCSEPLDVICGCISTALQVDVAALMSAAETCQDCLEQSPISSTTSATTNIQDINSSMPPLLHVSSKFYPQSILSRMQLPQVLKEGMLQSCFYEAALAAS